MKNKELFFQALNTLLSSFANHPSPEVIKGANELLVWFEAEYKIKLKNRFSEYPTPMVNFENVIREINFYSNYIGPKQTCDSNSIKTGEATGGYFYS